jgi:tetratricopeptide (TPR) repeat protein
MDEIVREALTTGRELYRQKEYARAEPYLLQVVEAQLPFADVYNMLGVIAHDVGDFPKAQQMFEESLRINPAYTEASLNLAVTYNDIGRYGEARDLYLRALTVSTKPGVQVDSFVLGKVANLHAEIADVYASAGSHDEAIAEYRRALALRPTFIDLRLKLAQTLRDGGHVEHCRQELEKILVQNPAYTPARLHLGLTHFARGDHAAALAALDVVLLDDPKHPRAGVYRDMIREHASRPKT